MSDSIFLNKEEDNKIIIPINREKTAGEIVPSEIIVYNANFAGVNTVQILLNSSRSIQVHDRVKLSNGLIVPESHPEKKFELLNYELGTVVLTELMAQMLFDKLKYALGK